MVPEQCNERLLVPSAPAPYRTTCNPCQWCTIVHDRDDANVAKHRQYQRQHARLWQLPKDTVMVHSDTGSTNFRYNWTRASTCPLVESGCVSSQTKNLIEPRVSHTLEWASTRYSRPSRPSCIYILSAIPSVAYSLLYVPSRVKRLVKVIPRFLPSFRCSRWTFEPHVTANNTFTSFWCFLHHK